MSPFCRISFTFHISLYLLLSSVAIGDSEQRTLPSPDNAEKPYLIRQITLMDLNILVGSSYPS